MLRNTRLLIIAATVAAGVVALLLVGIAVSKDRPLVTNFQECVQAGYKVIATTPRRCEIAKGLAIVEQVPNECADVSFGAFLGGEQAFSGSPAPVDFSTYDVPPEQRELLAHEAKRGVNFAGRFTIAENACGEGCAVIVDAKTGRIVVYGVSSAYGLSFKRASALLIVNPRERIPRTLSLQEKSGLLTTYYEFKNASLLPLCESPVH